LVQLGEYGDSTAGAAAGDTPTEPERGRGVARDGARAKPGAVHVSASGGIDRRATQSLLALRWSDVDEHRCAVSFTRAQIDGPGAPVLRATKTHRTYRVERDRDTLAVLVAHHARVEAAAAAAGRTLRRDAFVFNVDPDGGRPWSPNWLTKEFIRARRAANLPHFRLHDLRHFMATHMLAAGVPIATVSQRLSHARVSTTLNVYAHAVASGDRNAADTLAATLAAAHITPGLS
jgi:integrase